MKIEIIYINFLSILFSVSLIWNIGERTKYWPHIQQFGSWRAVLDKIRYLQIDNFVKHYEIDLRLERFYIFLLSWLIITLHIILVIGCLVFLSDNFDNLNIWIRFKNQIFLPFSLLILPYLLSRLIGSLAFIICPKDLLYSKKYHQKSFDCYTTSWKEYYKFETDPFEFIRKIKIRFLRTLLFILINFTLIMIN